MANINFKVPAPVASQLDVALSYNEAGWPVFPCRSSAEEISDRHTGEIMTLGEKTPLTSNGFKSATKFKRIIERWWADWPDAAIGLPTGAATGVFILDIDNKPGGANGFDWLAEVESEHGPLPETARVTSPNGGLHIYFKYVPGVRNRGGLGAGVDLRGEGGYVLAAGSKMADGRRYQWSPDSDVIPEVKEAPPWLLELLLPKKAASGAATYSSSSLGNTAYVSAAITAELDDLASTPPGGRNNRINDAAFALGQFVGAGALAYGEAERELQAIAHQWENFAKSCGTIRSGLDAGMRQPRVIPEPSRHENNTRLVDINRMIANGLAKAKEPQHGDKYDDHEEGHHGEDCHVEPDTETEDEQTPARQPAEDQPKPETGHPAANDNQPPIKATAFQWIDPKTLARREFAYGNHLIRKYVSVTVSPGGLGKTSLSLAESLAMTSGKALLGIKPDQRLNVWVFNAEDPRDEMERRIMAACIHYKLRPSDIEGHLFLDSGREQELVVAIDDKKTGVRIQQPIVEAVVEQIQRNKIDVMIVDPFVSTHGVNENDNGAIDKVAKLWAQIADYTNCAIDIVHHLRKVSDREAVVEDARGAVSLIGAARSVRVLNRMSAEQAGEAGLSAEERFGFFNVNYGKSNLTPLSSKLDWRKLVSVPLGNGRGLSKPQDFAPVVTEWRWPSAEDAIGEVSREDLANIITRVRNADCKLHHQADTWVGREIAYVLGLDTAKKADAARVKRLIKAWIDDGTFTIVNRRCPIKRENKDFVEVAEIG